MVGNFRKMLLFSPHFLSKNFFKFFFTSSPHFTLSAVDFCSVLAVEKGSSFPAEFGIVACTGLTNPLLLNRDPGIPCSFTAHFYQPPHLFQPLQYRPSAFVSLFASESTQAAKEPIPWYTLQPPARASAFPPNPLHQNTPFLPLADRADRTVLRIRELPEAGIPQHQGTAVNLKPSGMVLAVISLFSSSPFLHTPQTVDAFLCFL